MLDTTVLAECMHARDSVVHDAWLPSQMRSFEGVMRTCDYPFETLRVPIALAVRLHVDTALESEQSEQSHDDCAGSSFLTAEDDRRHSSPVPPGPS